MGIPGRHAERGKIAEFQRLRSAGMTIASAVRQVGISWNTGKAHDPLRGAPLVEAPEDAPVLRSRDEVPTPEPAAPGAARREDEVDEAKGTRSITMHVDRMVRTLDDLVEACQIDTSTWVVERWECSAWGVPMRLNPGGSGGVRGPDVPLQTQQFRVRAQLRRILPRPLLDAVRSIFEEMKAHAPRYPQVVSRRFPDDPHMLEIDLFDHHFGKLAWGVETGQDYDLRIAERCWREAVADLLSKSRGYEIDRVVIPLGNDLLHFDTPRGTTTAGTPMDADGRLYKVFRAAKAAFIGTVEELASEFPAVDVVLVQGNHDETLAYCLAEVVDAWFHHAGHVTVDAVPRKRKRVRYGVNLIGFTHGNMKNIRGLPTIMAQEWPEDWAATTHREWHLGHVHTEKKLVTQPVDTVDGVVIRHLKSLCGLDAWHYAEGYVGGRRAAEAYLWSFEGGLSGMFNGYIGRCPALERF